MAVVDLRKDEELVSDYASTGDPTALDELMRRRHAQAYHFALRALGDPGAAEDAAAEAFVALIRGARRFDAGKPFGPWWGALLANTVRDAARRRTTRRRHEATFARKRPLTLEDPGARRLEDEELAQEVRGLPIDVRLPVILHFYEGRSHEEVAATLGCPRGTVASRIRRGLEQLHSSLVARGAAVASVDAVAVLLSRNVARSESPAPRKVRALESRAASLVARALALKLAAASALVLALVAAVVVTRPGAHPGGDPAIAVVGTSKGDARGDAHPSSTGAPESAPVAGSAPGSKGAALEPQVARGANAAALTVLVTDELGRTAPDVEVLAMRRPAGDSSAPTPDWDSKTARIVRTDAGGVASFPVALLARGKVVWAFARRGLEEGTSERVVIGEPGASRTAIILVSPSHPEAGRGAVILRVMAAGRILGHQSVSVRVRDAADRGVSDGASRCTDSEGRYALKTPTARSPYKIVLRARDFAPATFEVVVEADRTLTRDVAVVPGITVTGRLLVDPRCVSGSIYVSIEKPLESGFVDVLPGGLYRARNLLPGNYTLVAGQYHSRDGTTAVHAEAEFSIGGAAEQETGPDLRLGSGPTVSGRVVDQEGRAVPGVEVQLASSKTDLATLATSSDGRFSILGIPPGSHHLRFTRLHEHEEIPAPPVDPDAYDGGYNLTFEGQGASVEDLLRRVVEVTDADVSLGDLSVSLADPGETSSTSRLGGRVVGPDGAPVASVTVMVWSQGVKRAATDVNGVFALENLASGIAWIMVQGAGLVSYEVTQIELQANGTAEVALQVAAAGSISGRVFLPRGHGKVEDETLSVSPADESPFSGVLPTTKNALGKDGTFRVVGLPPGAFELKVDGLTFPLQVHVMGGQESHQDLVLEDQVERIEVTVTGVAAPTGALVTASWASHGSSPGGRASVDLAGGKASLEGIAPGPVRVQVTDEEEDNFGRRSWSLERDVVVTPGVPSRVNLRWPEHAAMGSIRGKSNEPIGADGSSYLYAHAVGEGFSAQTPANPDGSFRIDRLPAGTYRVFLGNEGGATATSGLPVTVVAGCEAKVEGVPFIR